MSLEGKGVAGGKVSLEEKGVAGGHMSSSGAEGQSAMARFSMMPPRLYNCSFVAPICSVTSSGYQISRGADG